VHIISCNWLPFYRSCSFASQTFIGFADFLIIAFKLMQKKLVLLYYSTLLYTRKHYRYPFNTIGHNKTLSMYVPICFSHASRKAITASFPEHYSAYSYPAVSRYVHSGCRIHICHFPDHRQQSGQPDAQYSESAAPWKHCPLPSADAVHSPPLPP